MSGGIDFDPSREWLGIDAVDLADPFRVLGVAADVADPAIVTAAAARLLERLRGIDPGPFKRAHEALAQRIETSRDEVLAAVAARGPRFVPPPPAGVVAPALGPAAAAPNCPPPVPVPAGVPGGGPVSLPAPATEPDIIRVRRSAAVRRAQPSVVPTLLSLFALTLVGVAAYRFWPQPGAKRTQRDAPQVAVLPPQPQPPANNPSAGRPPIAMTPEPAAPTAPSPAVPPSINDEPAPASPPQQPKPSAPPAPQSPPTPPQPDRQALARTAAAIDEALRAAYAAILTGEFDTADRQVAAAAKLAAEDEDLLRRVTSWQQFARYARQAADYREQALDAANAGGDYDIGNQRIAVVESTRERFVYHKDGRNVRISPRTNVPGPIVTAILRAWFAADARPGNHVFLGTHLLARSEPNTRLAAAEWNRARQGGENVSNLEPLLNDPIIRRAAAE